MRDTTMIVALLPTRDLHHPK